MDISHMQIQLCTPRESERGTCVCTHAHTHTLIHYFVRAGPSAGLPPQGSTSPRWPVRLSAKGNILLCPCIETRGFLFHSTALTSSPGCRLCLVQPSHLPSPGGEPPEPHLLR